MTQSGESVRAVRRLVPPSAPGMAAIRTREDREIEAALYPSTGREVMAVPQKKRPASGTDRTRTHPKGVSDGP